MPIEDKKNSKKYDASSYRALNRILIHTGIWIVYFFYENGAVLILYPNAVYLKSSALYFLVNAFLFLFKLFFDFQNRNNQV